MKLRFIAAAAVAACTALCVQARKVHTIGDSTMATYDPNTTVTRGWGQMFQPPCWVRKPLPVLTDERLIFMVIHGSSPR